MPYGVKNWDSEDLRFLGAWKTDIFLRKEIRVMDEGYREEVERQDGGKCGCGSTTYYQHKRVRTWFKCSKCGAGFSIMLIVRYVASPGIIRPAFPGLY